MVKMKKCMIAIDDITLAAIDEYCESNGISRSAFIRLSCNQYLQNYKLSERIAEKTLNGSVKDMMKTVIANEVKEQLGKFD